MTEIVSKLVQAERKMATEKGRFLVFALFLREDAPDLWDLIVAAPWITENKAEALKYIASELRSVLARDELIKLSRIVIIDEDNTALTALQHAMHVEHGTAEIRDSNFFGLQIKHAYLITSLRKDDITPNNLLQATRD